MSLHHSLVRSLALGCSDIDKQVISLDHILAVFHRRQVVFLDKLNHVCKQRVDTDVFLQIFNCINNHSYYVA